MPVRKRPARASETTSALTVLKSKGASLWTTKQQQTIAPLRQADLASRWRFMADLGAKTTQMPPFKRVRIEARIARTSTRSIEPEAFAPVVKACIEGLVSAQILEGDGPEYVESVTYKGGEPSMTDSVTLLLRGPLDLERPWFPWRHSSADAHG